jgi:Tol biopolymer transport system component
MKLPSRNAQDAHVNVDLLSSYLDNQVTPEQQAYIEWHVRTCVSCQLELQSLRQTLTMLHALPRVPVPRAFTLSELQVGRRVRGGSTPWFGGLARAAGVLAAIVIIAASVAVLRQSALIPAAQVARVPAPAAAPTMLAAKAVTVAPAAPSLAAPAAPNAAPQAKRSAAQPAETQAAGGAAESTAPAASQSARSVLANPPAAKPTQPEPATVQVPAASNTQEPTASPAPTEAPLMALSQSPSAGPTATALSPAAAAAAAAAPRGLGAGNAESSAATSADKGLAAALPPPSAPLSSTLPSAAALVYADGQSVWALDRSSGPRKLVDQPGATMPVISPDKSRVAFWVMQDANPALWVVGWDGSAPHQLLAQQDLPYVGDSAAYAPPQFVLHDLRWVPGTHTLAFQTYSSPTGSQPDGLEELWNLDADSGALRQVLNVGMNGALAYSPDGKEIALMQRGAAGQPTGNLTLFGADGKNAHKVLDLPANPSGAGYDAQLSWLPDSRSLLAGVANPSPDNPGQIASVTLYRVRLDGPPSKLGQVPAGNAYWSPDGKHLLYTRPATETGENQQIVLANPDGSNAKAYQTLKSGMFAGWSPDDVHFLYQNEGNTYVGSPGKPPVLLDGLTNPMAARWVAPDQLVYMLDEPDSSVLVWQPMAGHAAALATLPAGVTFDTLSAK